MSDSERLDAMQAQIDEILEYLKIDPTHERQQPLDTTVED